MTSTASGVIAIAKERFRDAIATCTAFRTWDGENWSIAQAKEHIYYDALPPPGRRTEAHSLEALQALRPFCLIYKPADFGVRLHQVAVGGSNRFSPSGTLIARFERNVPAEQAQDPGEVDRKFENMMGALLSTGDANNPGLAELAGLAGYLNIRQIDEAGPFRSTEDERPTLGDCQWYYLQVEWGART